jgi:hypothetical protein
MSHLTSEVQGIGFHDLRDCAPSHQIYGMPDEAGVWVELLILELLWNFSEPAPVQKWCGSEGRDSAKAWSVLHFDVAAASTMLPSCNHAIKCWTQKDMARRACCHQDAWLDDRRTGQALDIVLF